MTLFSADVGKMQYCEVTLTEEKYQAFVYAVKNHYWYQMYIDDLPIWGMYIRILFNEEFSFSPRELYNGSNYSFFT